VQPFSAAKPGKDSVESYIWKVYLGQPVYLPPGQARQVRVKVEQGNPVRSNLREIDMVVPAEEMLAGKFCDFQEFLWRGDAEFNM